MNRNIDFCVCMGCNKAYITPHENGLHFSIQLADEGREIEFELTNDDIDLLLYARDKERKGE